MKTIAFSVPIFKYKVQNWNIKKKQLLDLFNNFQHKVVGNVITSPIDIKTNILLEEVKLFENEIGINWCDKDIAIKWPIKKPKISPRDKNNLSFTMYKNKFLN